MKVIWPARCVSHKGKTFVVYHKVTVFFACGSLGQIHADFLRLLWVLADKQMRSYYESMG